MEHCIQLLLFISETHPVGQISHNLCDFLYFPDSQIIQNSFESAPFILLIVPSSQFTQSFTLVIPAISEYFPEGHNSQESSEMIFKMELYFPSLQSTHCILFFAHFPISQFSQVVLPSSLILPF